MAMTWVKQQRGWQRVQAATSDMERYDTCSYLNAKETPASAAVRAASPIPPAVISSSVWSSSPAGLVANGGRLLPSLPDSSVGERSSCSDASQRP